MKKIKLAPKVDSKITPNIPIPKKELTEKLGKETALLSTFQN